MVTIKESKDLATYTLDELMGFLQSHEVRITRMEVKVEEKTFQAKVEGAKDHD